VWTSKPRLCALRISDVGNAMLRSRSSTTPSPVTSSAAPSPLVSVPVVGTMYGFQGAMMSAYSAISSRPAFVAKKP
jgi:hypothetical protein